MDTDNQPTPSFTAPVPSTSAPAEGATRVPARKDPRHVLPAHYPDPITTRAAILARAGFTEDVMAEITKQAVGALVDALTATKKTIHTYRGEVTGVSEEVDHGARGKAAERLLSVFGVTSSAHNIQPPTIVNEAENTSITLYMGGVAIQMDAGTTSTPQTEPRNVTPDPDSDAREEDQA